MVVARLFCWTGWLLLAPGFATGFEQCDQIALTGAFFNSSNMIFQTHPSVIVLETQLPSFLRTNNSQLPNKRLSRFDLRQTEMILDQDISESSLT
jgi:hypothetical protein